MATGVLIVLIYIWSGESLVALILAIVTLFAIAAIIEWKPWAALDPGTEVFTAMRHEARETVQTAPSTSPIWRTKYDITWDGRGVSGVSVGKVAPQLWSWSQIDDISQAWYDDQIALCLDFPSLRNPEEPEQAPVMFGPTQDPDDTVSSLRSAWRESKVGHSRYHDLEPAERTRLFGEHLGFPTSGLESLQMRSPALLYQELRRALLAGNHLSRISPDASLDEVLIRFDRLLNANDVDPLSQDEGHELRASVGEANSGSDLIAALHWTLDWVAEQRGLRLVFVDQGGPVGPGGERLGSGDAGDYLIGLIPADEADHWDGQAIGGGSTQVLLDPPS